MLLELTYRALLGALRRPFALRHRLAFGLTATGGLLLASASPAAAYSLNPITAGHRLVQQRVLQRRRAGLV